MEFPSGWSLRLRLVEKGYCHVTHPWMWGEIGSVGGRYPHYTWGNRCTEEHISAALRARPVGALGNSAIDSAVREVWRAAISMRAVGITHCEFYGAPRVC